MEYYLCITRLICLFVFFKLDVLNVQSTVMLAENSQNILLLAGYILLYYS